MTDGSYIGALQISYKQVQIAKPLKISNHCHLRPRPSRLVETSVLATSVSLKKWRNTPPQMIENYNLNCEVMIIIDEPSRMSGCFPCFPKCSVSPTAGWADDPLTRAASDSDRDTTAGAPDSGSSREVSLRIFSAENIGKND